MAYPDTITVTVNKSHITVLGEKLYAESIELLRELVNNAFDADATEVRVEVSPERIAVADDGTGMDYDGLVQYFNIGSPGKRVQNRSPRFRRVRIGQFGIGKFSSLTIARRFEVLTRRGALPPVSSSIRKSGKRTGTPGACRSRSWAQRHGRATARPSRSPASRAPSTRRRSNNA